VVVYLHGIQSHGGWYAWSASVLARAGAAVVLPDRRGSGMNEHARGDVRGADRLLKDIDELVRWVGEEFGEIVKDVVGVSWGGKLAAAWQLSRGHAARLLLIAPGILPAVEVSFWERLRIACSRVLKPGARFPIPLDDAALFTENPEGRRFIEGDTLKLSKATARFLVASAVLDYRLKRVRMGALPGAITVLLAGRDRIIRNEPTIAWLRKVCAVEPKMIAFPDGSHTLEFDAKPECFEDVLDGWARS
jgi:alpha-beta hydrolase superfamily lysophospholipase